MPDTEQFEAVDFIVAIEKGQFEDSFVAETSKGEKLYGSKLKRDGTPSKVWPLIKASLADEKYYKWTGNLKTSAQGNEFRQVTFGFEVEEEPRRQADTTPEPRVPNSGQPEGISSADLPPELAKPLEAAQAAQKAHSNGHKAELDSFTFGSVSRIVAGLAAAGKVEPEGAMGLLFGFYEAAKQYETQP